MMCSISYIYILLISSDCELLFHGMYCNCIAWSMCHDVSWSMDCELLFHAIEKRCDYSLNLGFFHDVSWSVNVVNVCFMG